MKQLTKVIYKPSTQSTEEFIMIVDAVEVSTRLALRRVCSDDDDPILVI